MFEMPIPLVKIISGGQTGADRGALDAALDAEFPCGGWCPKGRKAEDGRISPRYPLQETDSKSYADRTRRNIDESDGTLLVTFGEPAGGSAYTLEYAIESGARYLHVDVSVMEPSDAVRFVTDWIREQRIATLNIAGSRASKCPAIYIYVYALIEQAIIDACR